MMINKYPAFLLILLLLACGHRQDLNDDLVEEIILQSGSTGQKTLDQAVESDMQILFTQVIREDSAGLKLITHGWRCDDNRYFYPAGSIRLFIAMLALEKCADLNIPDISTATLQVFDSVGVFRNENKIESNLHTALARSIVKGDNQASDLLYDFLGQQFINEKLWSRGFNRTRITNRLSLQPDAGRDRATNAFVLLQNKDTLATGRLKYNPFEFLVPLGGTNLGSAHINNGHRVNEPMKFNHLNFSPLIELHHGLINLIFPQVFPPEKQFRLSGYRGFLKDLLRQASVIDSLPVQDFTASEPSALVPPDSNSTLDRMGCAGENLGFLVENGYYYDTNDGTEFIVSAVLQANHNQIFGDNIYDYHQSGLPLIKNIITLLAEHEKDRISQGIGLE